MIRVWEEYKKLEVHTKAIIWFTFANVMQKGATIIGTPIFTRIMSKSDFGMTTVYQSWFNIFSVIVTLNLSYGVFSKGLEKYENERSEFEFSIQSLSVFLAFGWLGIIVIFHNYFEIITGLDEKLLFIMFCSFFTLPVFDLWAAKQRFEYQYKKLVILSAINAVISIILPVVGIYVFQNKVLAKIIFSNLFLFFIGLFLCIKIVKVKKGSFSFKYWKYAICFNLPLIPHYLSMIILNHSDRIMIQKLCGDADAGMYSVAHQIANILLLITSAITASMTPFLYTNIKVKKIEIIRKNSYRYMIYVGMISLVIIIIAPELMKIFASKNFFEAVKCIAPLIMACFIQFSYSFFGTIEFYFEKTWFTLVISTGCTFINILLNFMFIPIYGYIACAYTTLFSFSIMALGHLLYSGYICKKNLEIKLFSYMKYLIIIGIFLCAGFVLMGLHYGYVLRYVILVLIVSIFVNKLIKDKRCSS